MNQEGLDKLDQHPDKLDQHPGRLLLATGAAQFVGDLPLPPGTLHAFPAVSPHAHASFTRVDADAARALPGVVAVLTAADIPGDNEIGNIAADDPLLADGEVDCVGQPYALVVADDPDAAWRAAQRVTADFVELPALLGARAAFAAGSLIAPPRTFAGGDVDAAWAGGATIVDGSVTMGGAEHVNLETQCALAVPRDDGGLVVHSGTQSASVVQRAVARVAGLPMHAVEVDVARLGGGFGGKEDQAPSWACLASLAALRLRRPVRVWPDRRDDLRITGKRHPYDADFRLGLDADGRFVAYEVTLYQDAGCTTDLSTPVLARSLFHATNAYHVPHVRVTGLSCRTNLPSNTAFRGFGAPQAMFVFEAAIRTAARRLGVRPEVLQRRNLLGEGDVFHYGMRAERVRARACWDELDRLHPLTVARRDADAWNAAGPRVRRGIAVVPVCFGISFTAILLNQAEALVHVYADGSVGVSTGAVEMGQGVNEKIRRVVARTLGIDEAGVRVTSTNTTRVANVSATAASTGADLNGAAAREACLRILAGLDQVADAGVPGDEPGAAPGDAGVRRPWRDLVAEAYRRRLPLSALAHYATPGLWFDEVTNTGHPFAYHVYGAALVEASVDVLLGTGTIDRVALVHDLGRSIDELTDRGQIEGAVVQGIGWMTSEELLHDDAGRLLTATLATYKIPDLHAAPEIEVHLLADENPTGLLGGKAVGEPPLVYGLGAFFALQDAVASWRPDAALEFRTPLTPERLFGLLHGGPSRGGGDGR